MDRYPIDKLLARQNMEKKINFYSRAIRTYMSYKIGRYNPFAIFFLATTRCNLDCDKCLVVGKFDPKEELKTREIFSLVDDAAKIGVCYFSVTGGEPLLRNDAEAIGTRIRENGMVSSLSTNGHLIDRERAEKLVKSFDYIRVSLDGFRRVNDSLRGRGSYEKTISGLESLLSVKKRTAKVGIISVIGDSNHEQIEEFFDYFKARVDFINFQPRYTADDVFKNGEFIRRWSGINKKEKRSADFYKFVSVPDFEKGKKVCDAGKLYLTIDPKGGVYPCMIERGNSIGNLREQSLEDIWNSKKLLSAREKNRECRGCYSKCTTEISMIFRMNPIDIFTHSSRLF